MLGEWCAKFIALRWKSSILKIAERLGALRARKVMSSTGLTFRFRLSDGRTTHGPFWHRGESNHLALETL